MWERKFDFMKWKYTQAMYLNFSCKNVLNSEAECFRELEKGIKLKLRLKPGCFC